MTNNGDIINKMMRAGNRHEKEYKVTVNKPVTDEFVATDGSQACIFRIRKKVWMQ